MVYRGKPSAGCENCRKAKKRCTLEQPACARCVKLKKHCSGYRDTTQLQIQDESEAVRAKATKKARQTAHVTAAADWAPPQPAPAWNETPANILTPQSMNSESSGSSSDDTIELPVHETQIDFDFSDTTDYGDGMSLIQSYGPVTMRLMPTADEIASTHFFSQFTSDNGHWDFVRDFARKSTMEPCLDLAIRACGMAALDNVQNVVMGKEYARSMYVEALGLLNAALRDPKRCKTDESLLAVSMLGYYENLTCESKESVTSWKAHISGATQLLKLRGKSQFKSRIGRLMFREIRAQILIHCIWDDLEPPDFLLDWEEDLIAQSEEMPLAAMAADRLVRISFDFAKIRAKIERQTIDHAVAADACAKIDERLIRWSMDSTENPYYKYIEVDVPDSPHIWNGMGKLSIPSTTHHLSH
jgi:hypothetical protein